MGSKASMIWLCLKESGLEKFLNYDWYRRASFIDHFIGETTLEEFAAAKYPENGDFVLGAYERKISRKGEKVICTIFT